MNRRITSMDKLILQILFDAIRMGSIGDFLVIIWSPKISTNCPWWNKSIFNQNKWTKGLRTLPNSIIDLSMRVLWNSYNKTLENIQKNIRAGALFYKNCTTDTFLVVVTKENMFKKNPLYSCPFFANAKGLQSRNSDFSKNRLQEKCFLRAFWNTSETSLEEFSNEVILLT